MFQRSAALPNAERRREPQHGGQAGTSWDMFQVKASESITNRAGGIGSRLAFRGAIQPALAARSSRQGPTPEMMEAYYKLVLFLSGDPNLRHSPSVIGEFFRVEFLTILLGLFSLIIAVKKTDLRIAFERQDVRGDPIQKPAIMRNHQHAPCKFKQRIFQRAQGFDIEIV